MKNLVSNTPHRVIAQIGKANYINYSGLLTSPQSGFSPVKTAGMGAAWAADNGAYAAWANDTEFDHAAFVRMLNKYRDIPGCLFIVAPDVVGDAESTLLLFNAWVSTIQSFGFPVAFVLQDGSQKIRIPWGAFQTLFLGGSTEFKLSAYTASVTKEAKRRGKWVHMGRVNSAGRVRYAKTITCDSFDGTGYSIDNRKIAAHLPHQKTKQLTLWEGVL